MKKLLFTASALAVLFASSCKKDDDKGPASNTWKVGDKSYSGVAAIISETTNHIVTTDASGNAFSVYFKTLPTEGGSYKVVGISDFMTLDNDEVCIQAAVAGSGSSKVYSSTGDDNVNATVTVSGETISVTVPAVNTEDELMENSAKVSGNISSSNWQ